VHKHPQSIREAGNEEPREYLDAAEGPVTYEPDVDDPSVPSDPMPPGS
jgi:hypothetical protein